MAEQKRETLTTTAGNPVGDNQNSMTIGSRGPLLLQDVHLIEIMINLWKTLLPF